MKHLIAPSVLSADFANLQKDIEMINRSDADWFHIDIMDGVFVPNISYGFPVLKAIQKYAKKPLDVHLMIEQPDRYAGEFIEAGADCVNVHLEARHQVARTLASIRERGCRAGLAINPATLLKHAIPLLPLCDQLICMTVNPGFGGQAFLPEVLPKIREARDVIVLQNYNVDITVDGGVSDATAASCSAAGANIMVAGSHLFSQSDLTQAVANLRAAAGSANVTG